LTAEADLVNNWGFLDAYRRPVFRGKLSSTIMNEVNGMVKWGKKIKDHPLGFMKAHHNTGTEGNAYQISVSPALLQDSFLLAYLNRMGERFISGTEHIDDNKLFRMVPLRYHQGHFDAYDLWLNFAYKGNFNPIHKHGGNISGVIYVKDEEDTPTIFEGEVKFHGTPGEVLMFPNTMEHRVPAKNTNKERITMAFNMLWIGTVDG